MKILLFRSNNLIASRCNKYVNYYTRKKIDFTAVGWDRNGSGITMENYDFYRYKAGVNIGGMKAIMNHIHWMKFVYNYIKHTSGVTTIHACDLNSAFPAVLYKIFHNKNLNVIFDACDWFSANFAGNRLLRTIFESMEKFTYNRSNALIICEPERTKQITFKIKSVPYVLPNIPDIDSSFLNGDRSRYLFDNDWITLSYFGGFTSDRFLMELLELTKTEQFNLLIGGFGYKPVEDLCIQLNETSNNVKYFGKMQMAEGLLMTSCADATYAMYCKTNPNHIYAAPNKLYEAMFLSKPIISTKGTIVELKINKYGLGWAIEESVDDVRKLIRSLNKEILRQKGIKAQEVWNSTFKNYLTSFFDGIYPLLIK